MDATVATPVLPNQSMQLPALRAAADPERSTDLPNSPAQCSAAAYRQGSQARRRSVYVWADTIHSAEKGRACGRISLRRPAALHARRGAATRGP
jgi:hypothetical protein